MADNLFDMLVFVRVVDAGSLSRAARDLKLSLAVISRKLARLRKQDLSRTHRLPHKPSRLPHKPSKLPLNPNWKSNSFEQRSYSSLIVFSPPPTRHVA